ncbi:MAG: RNA polymerase sigma factor [Cyclobacteriaceae bacterium]
MLYLVSEIQTDLPIKQKITIQEPELISRLKKKDRQALDYLYDHYSGAIYGVVLRMLRTEEIAEEVVQDVFLKIWDKIDQYDAGKGKLFTWMIQIARNLAIDKSRSKESTKAKKTDDIDFLVGTIDRQGNTEMEVDAIGLKEVLQKLPAEQQFIVSQLYLKGYTQSEVAEEFDIPLGTVKTRLRLAMNELRSLLAIE